MNVESLKAALGRKVVSTADAEAIGTVDHVVLDVPGRRVLGVVLGGGKKARVVPWSGITGFGHDAVMVRGDAARPAGDEDEHRSAGGAFDVLGRRTLSDDGNELGHFTDLTFDTASGALVELLVGEHTLPADALLGVGSYAVVVAAAAG